MGWACPKCGKVFAPSVAMCPCEENGTIISTLTEEVERLTNENAALAAGACLCVKGDERGNSYCEVAARAEASEQEVERLRAELAKEESDGLVWFDATGKLSDENAALADAALKAIARAEASESLLDEIASSLERLCELVEAGDLPALHRFRADLLSSHPDVLAAESGKGAI